MVATEKTSKPWEPSPYYCAGRIKCTTEARKKERKKTDNPREGWEDGTPPPHRDFKERCVVR